MTHAKLTDGRRQTWEVTIDQRSWEAAAAAACDMRAPCPLPGYETRLAIIKPRNRPGKGGRRCQLVLRFRLHNLTRRIDSRDAVEELCEPWEHFDSQ